MMLSKILFTIIGCHFRFPFFVGIPRVVILWDSCRRVIPSFLKSFRAAITCCSPMCPTTLPDSFRYLNLSCEGLPCPWPGAPSRISALFKFFWIVLREWTFLAAICLKLRPFSSYSKRSELISIGGFMTGSVTVSARYTGGVKSTGDDRLTRHFFKSAILSFC